MKYIIVLFTTLVFSCNNVNKDSPFTQIPIPNTLVKVSNNELKWNGDTLYLSQQAYTGYVYQLGEHSTDTIMKSGYRNGLQEGSTSLWYNDGQLKEKRQYHKGQKHGKQIAFWENGGQRFEFTAVNDYYEGRLREWDIEGNLIHEGHFEEGQEEGSQKMWHSDGSIQSNYVIVNGKRYGLLGTKNCKNVSDSIVFAR